MLPTAKKFSGTQTQTRGIGVSSASAQASMPVMRDACQGARPATRDFSGLNSSLSSLHEEVKQTKAGALGKTTGRWTKAEHLKFIEGKDP